MIIIIIIIDIIVTKITSRHTHLFISFYFQCHNIFEIDTSFNIHMNCIETKISTYISCFPLHVAC